VTFVNEKETALFWAITQDLTEVECPAYRDKSTGRRGNAALILGLLFSFIVCLIEPLCPKAAHASVDVSIVDRPDGTSVEKFSVGIANDRKKLGYVNFRIVNLRIDNTARENREGLHFGDASVLTEPNGERTNVVSVWNNRVVAPFNSGFLGAFALGAIRINDGLEALDFPFGNTGDVFPVDMHPSRRHASIVAEGIREVDIFTVGLGGKFSQKNPSPLFSPHFSQLSLNGVITGTQSAESDDRQRPSAGGYPKVEILPKWLRQTLALIGVVGISIIALLGANWLGWRFDGLGVPLTVFFWLGCLWVIGQVLDWGSL
jgi:hypothetical protein